MLVTLWPFNVPPVVLHHRTSTGVWTGDIFAVMAQTMDAVKWLKPSIPAILLSSLVHWPFAMSMATMAVPIRAKHWTTKVSSSLFRTPLSMWSLVRLDLDEDIFIEVAEPFPIRRSTTRSTSTNLQLQWSFIVLFTRWTMSGKCNRLEREAGQNRLTLIRTANITQLVLTVNTVLPVFKEMLVKPRPLIADPSHLLRQQVRTCLTSKDKNRSLCLLASDCNPAGTHSERGGRCICKYNVDGDRCDQCKRNHFYLNPVSPNGCLPCFCSGVSSDCSSSDWRRSAVSNDLHLHWIREHRCFSLPSGDLATEQLECRAEELRHWPIRSSWSYSAAQRWTRTGSGSKCFGPRWQWSSLLESTQGSSRWCCDLVRWEHRRSLLQWWQRKRSPQQWWIHLASW